MRIARLPNKNIDTGASVERLAVVLQDADHAFETDLLRPLVEVAEALSGRRLGKDERDDVSLKVIGEHGRATTFLIADGVQPSNEGRGYLVRRMLRRVVSHARRLGIEQEVMPALVARTVERFGHVYPELVENRAYIEQVASSEEGRFAGTLRQGMTLFETEIAKATGPSVSPAMSCSSSTIRSASRRNSRASSPRMPGSRSTTSGSPSSWRSSASAPKRSAKNVRVEEELSAVAGEAGATEFVGYQTLESEGRVLALIGPGGREPVATEGEEVRFVLDRTPFYAESGGQVGDQGVVETPAGRSR